MSKLKVTVLQSDITWENPEENLKNYSRLILSQPGSDLYVLPEMFNTGFTNNTASCAETEDGYSLGKLKEISKISGAAICGSLILREVDKDYNAFVFVKPDGEVVKYYKRHLFGYGGEADMFSQGQDRVIVDYMGFRILLLVCYDLRFPVWSRNNDDYDVLIYVSNWPAARRYAHDTLLKARAIENLAYLVSSNRIGVDGKGIKYDGGSCILDFKGNKIADSENNSASVLTAELDLQTLGEFRKSFPALDDKDSFTILK